MVVFMLYKFRFGVVVRLGIEQLMCFFRNTMQIYEMILNYQGILLLFLYNSQKILGIWGYVLVFASFFFVFLDPRMCRRGS